MPPIQLLKNLVLGFLPLLVFVLADEYLSSHFPEAEATRYALILGLGLGLLEGLYLYLKERRIEKLILLDIGLLTVMGGFSLISGNAIFFKLKPAIMQFFAVIFMGGIAFYRPQVLAAMSKRYTGQAEIPTEQLLSLQRSSKIMSIVLLLHTFLIVFAAFYLSKEAWAFISGPLLPIGFGSFLLIRLVSLRMQASRHKTLDSESGASKQGRKLG